MHKGGLAEPVFQGGQTGPELDLSERKSRTGDWCKAGSKFGLGEGRAAGAGAGVGAAQGSIVEVGWPTSSPTLKKVNMSNHRNMVRLPFRLTNQVRNENLEQGSSFFEAS